MLFLAAMTAALGLAAPDSTLGPRGEITRLNVSGYPTVRAWVTWRADPSHALDRVRADDLRAATGQGEGAVVSLIPAPVPGRQFLLVLPRGRDAADDRSRITLLRMEVERRTVPGDELVIIRSGADRAIRDGPLPPGAALLAALAGIPESSIHNPAAVLDAARLGLLGLGRNASVLVVLPSGQPWSPRALRRLAAACADQGALLVIVRAGSPELRRTSAAALGAVDGTPDLMAAARRWLMTAPSGVDPSYELLLQLPRADEGSTQELHLRFVHPIGELDTAAVASLPFVALAPGRVAVGAEPRRARVDPYLVATLVLAGTGAGAGLTLVALRRRR